MSLRERRNKSQKKSPPIQRQDTSANSADLETLPSTEQPLDQRQILHLQRTVGNQAVQRMISAQGTKAQQTPAKQYRLQREADEGTNASLQRAVLTTPKIGNVPKGYQPMPVIQMRRTAPHIQRNVMPVDVWKELSNLGVLHTRSTILELIDSSLGNYHTAKNDGARFMALMALRDYISVYEASKTGKESKRKEAMEVLKAQVANELTGTGPTFQLWTIDQFTEATKEKGKLFGDAGLSDFQEEIIDMMKQFHKLKEPTGADLNQAIGLLYEMRDYADYWFEQNNTRSDKDKAKRSNRAAGMQSFKDHLASIMPTVESFLTAGRPGSIPTPNRQRIRPGRLSGQAPQEDPSVTEERTKKVQEIRSNHVGSAKSLFAKVGGVLVDGLAGEAGSKASIELEVKIPVDPSGVGFLGGRFSVEAEAEKTTSKVRAELALVGGAKIPELVELSAEIGGYFEAQAQTAEKAMQLVSYAFYRKLRASRVVPREVGNYIWGGRTSELGYKIAERWAANVEKGIFNAEGGDDAYVEVGMLGGVKAKVGNDDLGVEGKLKATKGKKFSKKSISAVKGIGEVVAPPTVRGQNQTDMSENVSSFEVALAINVLAFNGEFKLKLSGDTLEGELNAQVNIPLGDGIAKVLVPSLETGLMKVVSFLRSNGQLSKKPFKIVSVGDALGVAVQGNAWRKYLTSNDTIVENTKSKAESLMKIGSKAGYGLNIKIADGPEGLEVQIALEKINSTEIELGVAKASYKKSQRIIGAKYKTGKWAAI